MSDKLGLPSITSSILSLADSAAKEKFHSYMSGSNDFSTLATKQEATIAAIYEIFKSYQYESIEYIRYQFNDRLEKTFKDLRDAQCARSLNR